MSEMEFWKDLGNIFDAVLNYQKKNVEFNNRFINPWIRLGNVFDRQDKTNDAVHAYQRATEIDPDTAQNWVDLGDAHFKNGTYDEAIEAYGKAILLDPNQGWPHGNLALSLVSQGKFEEAIPVYQKSIELLTEAKDQAICWNRLGNAYRKLNDYENAFLAFQKADELDGENTGFSDKLDEVPSSAAMVAPEEILEQMIEEQPLENSATNAFETTIESAQETNQSKVELETDELTELENFDEMIAIATTLEEQVLDEVKVGEPVNVLQVVEDVIAKDELAYTQQENSVIEEIQVNEVVTEIQGQDEISKFDTSAVAKNFAEMIAIAPILEDQVLDEVKVGEPVNVLQVVEDVIAKVELAYAQQENPVVEEIQVNEVVTEIQGQDEISKFDTSAVTENFVEEVDADLQTEEEQMLEETSPVAINIEEKPVQEESSATLSEVSVVGFASDSDMSMDIVETYTEPLGTQVETESVVSEEAMSETNDQFESQQEAVVEVLTSAAVDESNEVVESIVSEENQTTLDEGIATELAYEEYLKDIVEPTNILTEQAAEVQTETPVTKVSKNGEVRIEMDTKNAHVWNELGNIYLNANAYDDAITSYSKAIELDRHFAWPYSNLALAYVQKSRFAEAILLYQRGIELFTSDKDKAITWNRLGNVYRRINDYNNAIAAYQTADELDPENATLSLRLSFGLLGNMSPDIKPAFAA